MHETAAAPAQVPAPSHTRAGVTEPALHIAPWQGVLAGQSRQAPAPLHIPSCWQPDCGCAMH
jgi:hypothetical protein